MHLVEYHRYWVTAPGRKRPYLTSFPMTASAAAKAYPAGARPEPRTRELRQAPDTPDEQLTAMFQYQSAGRDSVQPPARQNAGMTPSRTPSSPGTYRFTDAIGGAPQVIKVRQDVHHLVALFEELEGDEGAEIPVADMEGHFEGPLP